MKLFVLLLLLGLAHAKHKNVLFLAVDDLRHEFSFSGPGLVGPGCSLAEGKGCTEIVTPNLAKLAKKSLFLNKNYVQQAVCSPTRTSILTSRRPDATRVWDLYSYFRDVSGNYTTIPQLFRDNGYETYGMGKIFHPGHASGARSPNCPNCSGDDDYWSWSQPYYHAPNIDYPLAQGDGKYAFFSVTPEQEAKYPLADSQLADHAVELLKNISQGPREKPFFVAYGGHRPHLPFVAPQAKFDLYPIDSIKLPGSQYPPRGMPGPAWTNSGELFSYDNVPNISGYHNLKPGQTLPESLTLQLRQAYYAAVSHMDEQVGRVLDALEEYGLADDTIISFWGDHGWQLGDAGMWCKHTNFEPAARAPMLIRAPGLTDDGIFSMEYTEHIDLMPTLAELAMNMTVPTCPDDESIITTKLCTMGTSLVPMMTNPGSGIRNASFSQYPRGRATMANDVMLEDPGLSGTPSPSICLKEACIMGYTVVTHVDNNEYRYTEWVEFNGKNPKAMNWAKNYGTELYDMTKDGTEPMTNLAGSSDLADVQQTLQAMLHKGPPPSGWGPYVA